MQSEFAIGILCGLRTFTAPAFVSRAAHQGTLNVKGTHLAWLENNKATAILAVLAAGEIIADKLPATPNRTSPGPLVARILSGSLCGAALSTSKRRCALGGAFFGALGAVAGAFAGYELRRWITHSNAAHIPDLPVALAEDGVTIGGTLCLLHNHTSKTQPQFRAQDTGLIHQEAVYAAID